VRLDHLEALDVLLRRSRVRRLGEDEDLLLHGGLELGEALVDGAPVAQDLDVLQRVGVDLAGLVRGLQVLDHSPRVALHPRKLVAMRGQQQVDREVGGSGRVLHHVARPRDGETLLDEAAQDVVDALSRQPGLARHLRRRERVAADERQVRLGLVAGQPKARELRYELAVVHVSHHTVTPHPWW
jgi:hypothetical protein